MFANFMSKNTILRPKKIFSKIKHVICALHSFLKHIANMLPHLSAFFCSNSHSTSVFKLLLNQFAHSALLHT